MEKVLEFLEKTHRANWLLFTVCLAFVNTFVFYKINCELWNYSVGDHHPFFLFLEIALLATGLTRILVAINFLYWVQLCPIIADVINLCWWERKRHLDRIYEEYCFHFDVGERYLECVAYGGSWESAEDVYEAVVDDYKCDTKSHMGYCRRCTNEAEALQHMIQSAYTEMQRFEQIAQITYSQMGPVIPSFIKRFIDKELYGFFLQKLWLKNGNFYGWLSLIFATMMILI